MQSVRLQFKYKIYLIILVLLSLAIPEVPYNSYISILFQLSVAGVICTFFCDTPVVSIPAILLLSVVPRTVFYGSSSTFSQFYQLNSTIIIMMCLVLVLYKLWSNHLCLNSKRISTIAALFSLFCILSISYTIDRTYYNDSFIAILVLYLSVSYFIETEKDTMFLWLSLSVSAIVLIFQVFIQTLRFGTIYETNASINRNYLAMITLLGFMILMTSLFLKTSCNSKSYLLLCSIAGIMSIYLIITYASRTAFLLMIVFSTLLCIYAFKENTKFVLLILLFGLVVVYWTVTTNAAVFLIDRLTNNTMSGGNGRFILQTQYIHDFLTSSWLEQIMGHGYKTYRAVFGGVELYAHNSYLGILMDFGLIGFCLFVAILVKTFWYLWHSEYRILCISFVVVIVYMNAIELHQDPAGVCYLMAYAGIADSVHLKICSECIK